ncbi:MAG: acetyl-CoA carboxylase biotin carboxyl carrier protein [Christensenellaceae bacterium]|jgi:acetyl-CoA carboxylase biotin carboxyl carrier protein|nr:acetyl-CoA carboxylase biotin carboxyl carrier protein [Christensenellaceae bacterium]
MNIREIRALAKLLAEQNLSVLEVQEGDFSLKLRRDGAMGAGQPQPAPIPAAQAVKGAEIDDDPRQELPEGLEMGLDFNKAKEISSPMVGVFYQSPAPGEKPFVGRGSKVKAGDVLCIIESMKLLNEISAKEDGEIVDILVRDGDVVEFGQALFKFIGA